MVLGAHDVVGRRCAQHLYQRGYHIFAVGGDATPGVEGEGVWTSVASWVDCVSGCAALIDVEAQSERAMRWSVTEAVEHARSVIEASARHGIRRVVFVSHRVTLGGVAGDVLDSASYYHPGQGDVPGWFDTIYMAEMMHRRAVVEEIDSITLVPAWCVSSPWSIEALRQMGVGEGVLCLSDAEYIAQLTVAALERGQRGRRYVCPGASGRWSDLGEMRDGLWRYAGGVLEGSWAKGALGVQAPTWAKMFRAFNGQGVDS